MAKELRTMNYILDAKVMVHESDTMSHKGT